MPRCLASCLVLMIAWSFGPQTAAASPAGDDDLKAVEKKISEAFGKLKSARCKVRSFEARNLGPIPVEDRGQGTMEWLRKDGALWMRTDREHEQKQLVGEEWRTTPHRLVAVAKGQTMLTYQVIADQANAAISEVNALVTCEPMGLLDRFRKSYDIELGPEQTREGHKLYLIVATPKGRPPDSLARTELFFQQDCGLVVSVVVFNGDGEPMHEIHHEQLELNVPIPESRFEFQVPEGVEIRDYTKKKDEEKPSPTTQPAPTPQPARQPEKQPEKQPG